MKVLFVAPKLKGGGAERQWSILIPGLKRKGFDVRLLTLHDKGRLFDQVAGSGVEARSAAMSSRFDVRGLRRALGSRSWRPDLIVSFGVSSHVIAALIARKEGAAHLLAEHGSMGEPSPRLKLYRRLLIKLVATVEQQNQYLHREFVDAMIDYKYKWESELARRQRLGLNLPEPVPHPDHIEIDMIAGTARLNGPWTKKEKALLDECQAAADAEGKDLLDWLIELRDEPDKARIGAD